VAASCVSMPLGIAQSNLKATASESCCQRGTTTFKFLTQSKTQSAVSSLPSKSKVRRHQALPKISEIVSPLHYCAYATGCRENISLLTEQALPLSEGSLSRQQVFGTSCVLALADSTLCCCINWRLQITAVLFCHER